MKILLALLVTFSVFANEAALNDEDTTITTADSECMANAKTMEEIAACDKAAESEEYSAEEHAKANPAH